MASIFGLPSTLVSAAFGGITGFLMKRSAMQTELRAAEHKHTIEALAQQSENHIRYVEAEVKMLEARAKFETQLAAVDPGRSATRSFLAIGLLICVGFFVPLLIWQSGVQWLWTIEQTLTEGWWIFKNSRVVTTIEAASGIPVEWLTAFLDVLAMTFSFYFGANAASYKNPYHK